MEDDDELSSVVMLGRLLIYAALMVAIIGTIVVASWTS